MLSGGMLFALLVGSDCAPGPDCASRPSRAVETVWLRRAWPRFVAARVCAVKRVCLSVSARVADV